MKNNNVLEFSAAGLRAKQALRAYLGPIEAALRELMYWKWLAASRVERIVPADGSERATVVIPTYAAERARNLEPMIRHLLMCRFVERIIVSMNNPGVRPDARVGIRDERLTFIRQPSRRGPGSAWLVAAEHPSDFLFVLDDDLLATPSQLRTLFRQLRDQPEVPHGLAGKRGAKYLISREAEVDVLFSAYAVTRSHLGRYMRYLAALERRGVSRETVEFWADDLVISRTGSGPARIHDMGFVSFCRTATSPGVALYKEDPFRSTRSRVLEALDSAVAEEPATAVGSGESR